MEDWKTIGGWIVTLLGAGSITALFKWFWAKLVQPQKILIALENLQSEIASIKEDTSETKRLALYNRDGIKYTQRYRLYHDMSRAIANGYTTTREIQELTILFESYVGLGGNGAVKALYEKFTQLEIKE